MKKKKAAPHSRFNTERKISIFWTLFIGIGAVGGAVTMLIDPSGGLMGMDAMLPYFKKLPFADVLFTDFVFSGIALLIVNGITNLIAAVLLFAKKKSGAVCSMIFSDALDMHSVLYVPVQFHVHLVFYLRFPAGGNGICRSHIL